MTTTNNTTAKPATRVRCDSCGKTLARADVCWLYGIALCRPCDEMQGNTDLPEMEGA